ncbi:hypothetical protein ABSA28_00543 [Candidatus Hepatincolaceae symbiont of Richtersius coronifer]
MLNIKVKTNSQSVSKYIKKHNINFKSQVGFFSQTARKTVGESLGKATPYGKRRQSLKSKARVSNVQVAYVNIFGIGRNPARNFFKLAGNKKYWQDNNFDFLKKFFVNSAAASPIVSETINAWNNLSKAVLRRSILDFKTPPNSPITIAKKGFNNPLIDSQQMLKAIAGLPYKKINE